MVHEFSLVTFNVYAIISYVTNFREAVNYLWYMS